MQCSLRTEAWQVYALALLNVLMTNYFVHSCDLEELLPCGVNKAPTNRTNTTCIFNGNVDIVDLNSSGCNSTHIWVAWDWTTPMDCDVVKVVIRGYTCYLEDGSRLGVDRRNRDWPCRRTLYMTHGINEWSCLHEWNTSSTPPPLRCDFNAAGSGYFEIDRPCLQNLLPINLTCSNVQPTSTSSVLMLPSSALILTTQSQKRTYTSSSALNTLIILPTPAATPEQSITFSNSTLSETWTIVLTLIGFIVALLFLAAFVVMLLVRWKNKKPKFNYYTNYDKDLIDFKPGFTPPVIPGEVIFKGDIVSIRSTIAPLEKIGESTLIFTDISTAHKLSQPRDYREQG